MVHAKDTPAYLSVFDRNTDLLTCPYLTVFVQKLAGSMSVRLYFSKY